MMAKREKPADSEFVMAEKTLVEDAPPSAIAVLPQSSPVNEDREFVGDALKKKMPEIFAALFADQQNLQLFRNFVSVSEATTVPFTYQDLNGTHQKLDPTFVEEYKNALNFVHKVKTGGEKAYKGFSRMIRKCIEKHMSLADAYCEVLVLFPDHKDLQEGVRRFMPVPDATHQDLDANQHGIEVANNQIKQHLEENYKRAGSRRIIERSVTVDYADRASFEEIIGEPINFFQKVRTILSSREVALTFLKIFHAYNNGKIGKDKLEDRVEAIIGNYPNLMAEFKYYLRDWDNIDGFLEIKQREEKVNPAEKCEDRNRDKYKFKSIQQLDLSKCKRCSPSYRLLPEDHPRPSTTKRRELEWKVLNDDWICVPSQTWYYPTAYGHKNQDEVTMLECDDEEIRFELDMVLHWYEAAAMYLRELLNGNIVEDDKYGSRKRERVLFKHCMERLYGGHALDAIDAISKNPKFAMPFILAHLEKTVDKLKDDRSYFNRKWTQKWSAIKPYEKPQEEENAERRWCASRR